MRPGGDLVDEQSTLGRQEELDAEDAHRPQRLGDRQGQRSGLHRDGRADRRGHHRRVEDVPLVAVQADRVGHGLAVGPPGHDDRDLGGELDPALGDAGHAGRGSTTPASASAARSTRTCPLPS